MATLAVVPPPVRQSSLRKLGIAWVLLCLSLALHVVDEAANGFLYIYNPTVIALREKLGGWPMPTFEFTEWFVGLVVGVVLLLAASPFVFRGARWIRPIFYIFVAIMFFNGVGHTLGTIFGRTVSTVHFSRPMPGFVSSPFLFAASVYAFLQLLRTRPVRQ